MDSRVERFIRRQQIRAQLKNSTQLVAMPSGPEADRLNQCSVDQDYLDQALRVTSLELPTSVPEAAVEARLNALAAEFNQHRFDQLLVESRRGALQAIVEPFGLGKMLSAYDKTGGNVNTIHNVREGVYATEKAAQGYAERGDYKNKEINKKYHNNNNYVTTNGKYTEQREQGELIDAYTGDKIDLHNLDHTIAAKEIHDDAGRVLAELDGPTLANRPSNLNATAEAINKSKKQRTAKEYVQYLERTKATREAELIRLREKQASDEPLTQQEETKLNKYTEQEKIAQSPELLLEKDRIAREEYEKSVNDAYYKGEQFRKDCLHTSVREGGKVAFQAAVGVMLVEFFTACFDEIGDWYRNGAQEARISTELKRRMEQISRRVISRWQEVLVAAGTGFISGLLSNLVTALINAFLTTAKRVVRMVRQGDLSLLSACKTLLIRPEGMSFAHAMHASSKVLISGGIVAGGVMLEEMVSKYLMAIPVIMPFADLATAVIVGATSAIVVTVAVYLIDKLDFFGVNRGRLLTYMNQELDHSNEQEVARENTWLDTLENQLACYKP